MKSKFVIIAFFLMHFLYAQLPERAILRGKVISDSLEVENITVFNITSNIGAITNVDGEFSIKARARDTLFFQGISFVSQKYVLTEKDFWVEELEIRLNIKITELNEVEISPSTLTGTLKEDTRRLKVYGAFSGIDAKEIKYYADDVFKSAPPNSATYSALAPNGSTFDFKLIGKGIGKLLGIKSNPKKYLESISLIFSTEFKTFSFWFTGKTFLKASEKEVIDRVIEQMSDWSAAAISNYSHKDMPWQATKEGEEINYELAFYREAPFSVRNYGDEMEAQ